MPRVIPPGPNPLTQKMVELLRKVPGAETVGNAVETMTGPENPPVHMALKAMNRADPYGLMSMGMPMGMAAWGPKELGAMQKAAKMLQGSKVKDRVYHLTKSQFDEFIPGGGKVTSEGNPVSGKAIWFSESPENIPARHNVPKLDEGARTIPAYVDIQNPLRLPEEQGRLGLPSSAYYLPDSQISNAKKAGYDGIIQKTQWRDPPPGASTADEVIAFDPGQVHNAISGPVAEGIAAQKKVADMIRNPTPAANAAPPGTVHPLPPNPGSIESIIDLIDGGKWYLDKERKIGPNEAILRARHEAESRAAMKNVFGDDDFAGRVKRIISQDNAATMGEQMTPANQSMRDGQFETTAQRLKLELQDKMTNDPARWLVEDGMTREDFADTLRKAKPRNEPRKP